MSHVQQQAVRNNGGVPIFYLILTPLNYTVWAIKTEAILDAQGVWEAVEPVEGAQMDAKKDKKTRAYILQFGSLQCPKIQSSTTMSHVQQQAVKDNDEVSIFYLILTPLNYTVWAIKTEAIFDAQGVWEAVELVEGAQVDAKKDKKTLSYILQCIPEDILLQIAKKKIMKEIWKSIKTTYLGSERVKKA
ncbi:hypothetical protein V6N13_068590 [Hibiscus sabdariffa]